MGSFSFYLFMFSILLESRYGSGYRMGGFLGFPFLGGFGGRGVLSLSKGGSVFRYRFREFKLPTMPQLLNVDMGFSKRKSRKKRRS